MPLWGKYDAKAYQGTTLAVENGNTTITGTSTKFQVDLKSGDVLEITSGTTTKNRVKTITSNTVLVLADAFTGTTAASLANTATTIQQLPKSAWHDANNPKGANNNATIFGVDTTEIRSGGDNITSVALVQGGTLYREAPPVTFAAPTLFTIATTAVSTTADTITSTAHGLSTGAKVTYGAASGTVLGGLSDATAYYVIYVDVNTFKLASSAANALAGTAIDLTGTGNSSQTFQGDTATATVTVSANSVASITLTATGTGYTSVPAVTIAKSRLTVATANVAISNVELITYTNHGLSAGEAVKYFNSTGSAAAGLANNTTYYVASAGLTANTFKVKAANTTVAVTGVAISNSSGGFTCTAADIAASDRITITGTLGGTGTITGYTSGTVYFVSAVSGSAHAITGFTLVNESTRAALTTTAGTPTGLTYTDETVMDITGTGNNAQYFEKNASTAATATAARGSGGNANQHSKASHVGWVKRTVGTGGRAGRVTYETLVAMGSITGDAADDLVLPDA